MADGTKIEWAEATANYVNGCSLASPGCTNCYAMRLAGTRLKNVPSRAGLTQDSKAGPVWTGEVRENPKVLSEVLGWKRRRAIFWNAHGDLFYENVPDERIDKQFAVMALTPQHRHMVLTKRSARMREYVTELRDSGRWLLLRHPKHGHSIFDPIAAQFDVMFRNVWLGVSVEDQRRADERIPDLLATPASIRFISAEPLLGPVDLTKIELGAAWQRNALTGLRTHPIHNPATGHSLDWVIVGGESGPGARPMHPAWARSLRDQCEAAGVAFHFKQWGAWISAGVRPAGESGKFAMLAQDALGWSHCSPIYLDHYPRQFDAFGSIILEHVGKKRAGRLLDGVEHDGVPS